MQPPDNTAPRIRHRRITRRGTLREEGRSSSERFQRRKTGDIPDTDSARRGRCHRVHDIRVGEEPHESTV